MWRRRLLVLLLLLSPLAACYRWVTSREPLAAILPEEGPRPARVRVQTTDQVLTLHRPALAGDTLVGYKDSKGATPPVRVPLGSIVGVEVRRVDGMATAVGVVLGAAAILAIVFAETFELFDGHGSGSGTAVSCPLVYSWDGSQWLLDSGTFGGAITRGLQRTDVDNLIHLVPIDGVLRLRVANELQETDHIDGLDVLVVDHPTGTRVAPDPAGGLHLLRAAEPPTHARDDAGNDVLARVLRPDGAGWESRFALRDTADPAATRDGIELRFRRPRNADEAHLVLDGNSTTWAAWLLSEWLAARGPGLDAWYAAVDANPSLAGRVSSRVAGEAFLRASVLTRSGWQPQALYWEAGPEISKRQVVHLDLREIQGPEVVVRLEAPPAFWWIDAVALEAAADEAMTLTPVRASRAHAHDGSDPRARLEAIDDRHLTLETGEWVELEFLEPSTRAGVERSYLLRSTGWYRITTTPRAVADLDLLRRVDTEPGAISRVATERFNQSIRALTAPR